jgi:(S)-2-hydroxyglutarate dehydrogenase
MNASDEYDVIVIGGGIVGLATALALRAARPDCRLAVLEKEPSWGAHQTGHNSGVIHAGVYYRPGSEKARLCVAGNRSMVAFCEEHGIRYAQPGKLVVATSPEEIPRLEELQRRTAANGVTVRRLRPEEAVEREPHVRCVDALFIPSTGVVDFRQVAAVMVDELQAQGVVLHAASAVTSLVTRADSKLVMTSAGALRAKFVVACAGLQSDLIARLDGVDPGARILPFRGEYYEVLPERRELVRALVYPVPNPAFPFLGVHFTRGIDGSLHAGPNAVPALRREGYRRRDASLREIREILRYPGTWRLARRYAREGAKELARSASRRAFTRALQRLVPDIRAGDLTPAPAGVRAQAVTIDGALIDDFLFVTGPRSLHVCNAPSPAATASLEIGRRIAGEVIAAIG